MKNHFIIIGTPKSGSSTLYGYLNDHPNTFLTKVKEHNFFMDIGYNWNSSTYKIFKKRFVFFLGNNFSFVKKRIHKRYKKVSKQKKGFYSGDGSINYFYNKEVPSRIKTYCPNSKLILLLRNPIDRLYSNYWMNQKQNISSWHYNSFEDFFNSGAYKHEINLYSTSLKRWLKYFQLDDILIIESSMFFKNTKRTLIEIENFLGIENYNYPKSHFVTPFQTKASNYPKMDTNIRQQLTIYFRPFVSELEQLTQQKFNWTDFE
jgi:hypothetical protein